MNIVIVGDTQSVNYGDPILTQCTKRLFEEECAKRRMSSNISVYGIINRTAKVTQPRHEIKTMSKKLLIVKKYIRELYHDIRFVYSWHISGRRQYAKRLNGGIPNDTSLIVFAGGAMLSGSIQYALAIQEIVKFAEMRNIYVAFFSVGIERSINWRTVPIIRRYLKYDRIIAFSTRDHVDLVPQLTNKSSFYLQTPDSGFFASEVYQVSKQQSGCIGLGLISYEAYLSVARDDSRVSALTENLLFEFWKEIINQLNNKGYKWKIFTNGGTADYKESLRFVEYMGFSKDAVLCAQPEDPKMLVEEISEFSLIIGHRLHSLIVGSSFCIPVIPIVWSDKVVSFANLIETSCYWPTVDAAKTIVDTIPDILERKNYNSIISSLKTKSREFITKIINSIE